MARMIVTHDDIAASLRQIGVQHGALVQVHSSLSAFGYVEGGAETVVDALLDVIGTDGTLMVPTFNHGNVEIFDIRTTPSRNGAITEAVRKRPDAIRSFHPTHPYAAIGPLAHDLTDGHIEAGAFGAQSPLGKLAIWGGYTLLLGVGMRANTAAHIGEVMASVKCIGPKMATSQALDQFGHVITVKSGLWRNGPCLIEWDAIEQYMRQHKQIADGFCGAAETHLMRAADVIGAAFTLTRSLCPQCSTTIRFPDPEESK